MALNKKKLMGLLALLLDDEEEEEKPSPVPSGLIPSFLGEGIEQPGMVPIGPARPQPNTGNPRDSMVPLINWQGDAESWQRFLENWRRGGAAPQAPVAPGADRHPPMPPQNNFGMIPDFGMQGRYQPMTNQQTLGGEYLPNPFPEEAGPLSPKTMPGAPDPFAHRMPQEFEGSRGFVDTFNTLGGMPTYAGLPDSTYLDYTDPINRSPASGGPGITGEFDNYAPDDMSPWSPADASWWGDPEDQSIQQIKGPVGRETDERYGRVTPEGIVPLRDTPGGVANEDRGNPFLTAQGVVDPATGQRRVSTPVGQPIPQPNEEVGFMDREISDHGQKMRNVMDAYYGGADFGYETEWAEGLGVAQKDIDNFMAALNSGDIDAAMQSPTDFMLEEFERKWGWPLNVNSSSYTAPESRAPYREPDIDRRYQPRYPEWTPSVDRLYGPGNFEMSTQFRGQAPGLNDPRVRQEILEAASKGAIESIVNKYGFHTVQRVIKEDIASGQFHMQGDLRPDTDDDVALVALERLRKKRERERNWE